jgi:hypothetical protein
MAVWGRKESGTCNATIFQVVEQVWPIVLEYLKTK